LCCFYTSLLSQAMAALRKAAGYRQSNGNQVRRFACCSSCVSVHPARFLRSRSLRSGAPVVLLLLLLLLSVVASPVAAFSSAGVVGTPPSHTTTASLTSTSRPPSFFLTRRYSSARCRRPRTPLSVFLRDAKHAAARGNVSMFMTGGSQ
ncbi:unnamed protein product, partial [Scytosiphon promiscuus]